uniref:non-specific serine/threonine protein kinase n=1 Tax=Leersia perrieri TaxID=77586 RepID=A0A0D9VTE5_9ORYZ
MTRHPHTLCTSPYYHHHHPLLFHAIFLHLQPQPLLCLSRSPVLEIEEKRPESLLITCCSAPLVSELKMYRAKRAALSPKVKRRVGKYELGRTIGEGTFGKVRFAKNTENDEPVAIKILDKEKVQKNRLAEQIRREICTMKLVRHPNVVRLFEVMGSKARIFIVLEYVTGGELFEIIETNGRLKEEEARKYFQQLINAVDYCHSRGVYHRDLKLENLLLDASGNLKVSDFGLSALTEQVKADGLLHTTCGTPNYVAPEVIEDRGYDGAAADIWSCGVILFVLLAGFLPFEDDNIISLYKKISEAQFTCPSWFSAGAKKLITRILDPNPTTRISISKILEDPWFRKGYKPPVFDEKYETSFDDVDAAFGDSEDRHVKEETEDQPTLMNAFELISLNEALNLDNLFEAKKVFQVAPSLHVVELKKAKGDTLEFQKFYRTLSTQLKDVVWKCDGEVEGNGAAA